eukprot:gene38186-46398_t
MFSTVARRSFPVAASVRRNFSSGHGDAKAEVARWHKLSIGMAGLSTVLGIYTYFTNTHDHARSGLPYQKIRSKPYPWACSDCALFD